ncbi:MAG: carbohydrate deacetylase [Acidaminococcales bacterium]|jgi:predicted glycoside hydrolase/deacetylase ChbG (UPF0249 family)|nr:carbohydrate deacetylase [Acidaminococcales bacterium]
MRNLIVNADDFALSTACSAGIIEAFKRGAVTSSSMMVTVGGLEQAAALAKRENLPLGLHLCLTYGRPAAAPGGIRSLLDEKGFFKDAGRLQRERPAAAEVETEWRAQLERLLSLGIKPDHLDSHHFIHEYLGGEIEDVAIALARELGVPLRRTAADSKDRYRQVRNPDFFFGGFYGEQATLEQLLALLADPWEGTLELMCHPGRADDELAGISSYSLGRQNELEILLSPRIRAAARAQGIDLVSFAAV